MINYSNKSLQWIAAAVILLIFFHYLGWLRGAENFFLKGFQPGARIFYNWGTIFKQLTHLGQLTKENQKLQEELAQTSLDYVKLTALEAENQYLRTELNFLTKARFKFQLANIIGRLSLNDQILIIDRGSLDGLKAGLPVTLAQGVMIGKIIKAEENRAYVELLTSINSQLAVTLSDLSGASGLLRGKTGNSLLMDLIPQDQEIKPGDLVVSAALEELVPAGLLIGRVENLTNLAGQIFKTASLAPLVNYQNLRMVTVILDLK